MGRPNNNIIVETYIGISNSIDAMNKFSKPNNHINIKVNINMANTTDLENKTDCLI